MSPFDHPVLSAWIGDPDTSRALSFEAELAAMLRFEIELAAAQAEMGLIPPAMAARIADAAGGFAPDRDALRRATARDGVVVPGLMRQVRDAAGEAGAYLHLGATSQDVIDTALMLRLSPLLDLHAERLRALGDRLDGLARTWGDRPIMGVTRMRDALPITVKDRIDVWSAGLRAARARSVQSAEQDIALQFAGPVGTLEAFGAAGPTLRANLAARLGLSDPGMSWQTERSRLLRIAAGLAETVNAVAKIGADIGLMAQDGVGKIRLDGGASSSMAHKVNPVDAELLIALSAHAGMLLGATGQAGLHASERAGAAWTLEWLTLPQLVQCTGAALQAGDRLLAAIRDMG